MNEDVISDVHVLLVYIWISIWKLIHVTGQSYCSRVWH